MTCKQQSVKLLLYGFLATMLVATVARAEDWPTYRHDTARSGVTSEKLDLPLVESWAFKSTHAPRSAWDDPKPEPVGGWYQLIELRRNHFDDVFQPVAADGAIYFGSSADNKVYCLDAATGKIRWTKITGGPVRLAPTLADGRVYFGSDDGYAYCLDAKDGSVVWKFHAAPEDQHVLGSGRMISLWPLRTGVLIDDGIAYFGAGIFPAEGVFLYAVDADTGRNIWCNDTCGEKPMSRISPQGYMLASKSHLYVPMGRVSPAAFDRRDGRLVYETYFGHETGGTYALLAGNHLFTGTEEMIAYDRKSPRNRFAWFGGRQLIVTRDISYMATDREMTAINRKNYPEASRRRLAALKETRRLRPKVYQAKKHNKSQEEIKKHQDALTLEENKFKKAKADMDACVRWRCPTKCPDALILAGNTLFAGGKNQVVAVDATTGKQLWNGKVEGTAKGLAVADGRLLVSTDKGLIYCFGPSGTPQHGRVTETIKENPYADSPTGPMFRQAAETILSETGVKRGFCLVLGLETGELALELARRSELMIYAVSPDADKVAAARKTLDAAGVYGDRVCVEQWPLDNVPYSDYFANLIVSETAMLTGELPDDPADIFRMLKPLGGVVMIGQPAECPKNVKPLDAETLNKWLKMFSKPRNSGTGVSPVVDNGIWATITRGPLPGVGSWTHQYAQPSNTACGDDQLVNAPFGVLWYGAPGPARMNERHRRAAAPLSLAGRMFVQGENTVMAYDAYNGVKLWQRDIPGAIRTNTSHTCGNMALSRDGLFVATGNKCLRLDPATGLTKATYTTGDSGRWTYVACVGKLLYGSRDAGSNSSNSIFVVDVETGERRWTYDGKKIPNNTITIGDGKVFLVTKEVADGQRQKAIEEQREIIKNLSESLRARAATAPEKADVRTVIALDAKTGKVLWKKPVDLTGCGGHHAAIPGDYAMMSAMYNHGVLTLFGVYLDGHFWKQFFAGQFDSRRVTAVSAEDGKLLWSRPIAFRVRPLIVGDTFHAEPWAFDLHTGEQKTRVHPVTGKNDLWQFARPGHHCGCPCAAPNCMLFRSWNLGYYDLVNDYGTMHFGSHRPGCWINFIPAGGLLLVPEASAGCMCSFPNMCSIAFKPTEKNKAWAWYSAPGPMTPVKRLALNFGAPGDRKDAAGKLWLGYPRPLWNKYPQLAGKLLLQFKFDTVFHQGGKFSTDNSVYTKTTGTDDPWLFASVARGLHKCTIPLRKKDDGPARYTVRLAFADPKNDQPGRRIFDIKLQGRLVQENFDIVRETGGRDRAVFKQFDGIEVVDNLVVELISKTDKQAAEQLPILHGVEIVRE